MIGDTVQASFAAGPTWPAAKRLAGIQILSDSVLSLGFFLCPRQHASCVITINENTKLSLVVMVNHCNTIKYSSVFKNDYKRYSFYKTKAQ